MQIRRAEPGGVAELERNVMAALDVSKTREVALRCHVKGDAPDGCWVIVPHVGCSHQHSRFVLSIFAALLQLQLFVKFIVGNNCDSINKLLQGEGVGGCE